MNSGVKRVLLNHLDVTRAEFLVLTIFFILFFSPVLGVVMSNVDDVAVGVLLVDLHLLLHGLVHCRLYVIIVARQTLGI